MKANFPLTNPQSPTPSSQRWLCLSVEVPREAAEAVANFLVELGSIGVVEGVRDFQQPPTATTQVQGFFPADTAGEELSEALNHYLKDLSTLFANLGFLTPYLTEVTSDTWHERWREHFPPITVGEHFLLLPPWESTSTDTDRVAIVIDPSMAFGTGHHATTQGCLEAIDRLHQRYGAPARALDLGTGSGILAIALAKLGTPHVWATDIDPVALDEAHKNAEANQVASFLHLSDSPIEGLPIPFPLIVANLFSTTLISLVSALHTAVECGGHAILSGIQHDQEADVLTSYAPPTWRLITRLPHDEWVTVVLQRT